MDERKCYSRDWRTRFPWLKLKTRAWITCSISLGVSSNPMRLIDTEKERDDGGNTASNERG